MSPPAFTTGVVLMVNVLLSVTVEMHGAIPFAVKVRTTLPEITSPALGVYTGFNIIAFENVPVPLVVQVNDE